MPRFPGGETELMKFIAEKVKYPAEVQDRGIQGRVFVSFVVNEDGSLSDLEIVESLDPLLDEEFLRVIRLMPRWTPGKQRGQNVAVKYTVPVTFSLQ